MPRLFMVHWYSDSTFSNLALLRGRAVGPEPLFNTIDPANPIAVARITPYGLTNPVAIPSDSACGIKFAVIPIDPKSALRCDADCNTRVVAQR